MKPLVFLVACFFIFSCASQVKYETSVKERYNNSEDEIYFELGINMVKQFNFVDSFDQFFLAEKYNLNKAIIFNCYAHFQNGDSYFDKGESELAIENFTWVIENMSRINIERNVTAMQQYRNSLYAWGERYEIDLFGLEYRSYISRARCYINIQRYNDAISDYSNAIKIQPEEVLYLFRGDLYFSLENYQLALEDYKNAAEISQNPLVANENINRVNERLEEIERDQQNTIYISTLSSSGIDGLIQYIKNHKGNKYFNNDVYVEVIRRQQRNNNIKAIITMPYGNNADIPNPYNFSRTEIYFCPLIYVQQWLSQSFLASTGTERSTIYIRNAPDIRSIGRTIQNVYLKYNGVYEYTSTSRSHEEVPSFDIIFNFE